MELRWPESGPLDFVWSQIFAYMKYPEDASLRHADIASAFALALGRLDNPPELRNQEFSQLQVMLDSKRRVHADERREVQGAFDDLGGFSALEVALSDPRSSEQFPAAELRTVGFVLATVCSIEAYHRELPGGGSVKKAAFLIESAYRNRGLLDNERDIRKAWARYKRISPLVASLHMMIENDGELGIFDRPSLDVLRIFFGTALYFQKFGTSFHPHGKKQPLLDEREIWAVPHSPFRLAEPEGPLVSPLTESELAILREYRA
jgi:hypothetical protein